MLLFLMVQFHHRIRKIQKKNVNMAKFPNISAVKKTKHTYGHHISPKAKSHYFQLNQKFKISFLSFF